jgi:hypothetical protein
MSFHFRILKLKEYCDMWVVSKKRIGKCIVMERLIHGNQLVTEHVSMDTKTEICKLVKTRPLL